MSTTYPPEGPVAGPAGSAVPREASVGELVGEIGRDLSTLMRQELALAKAEVKVEAKKAGLAAGLYGGAGFSGYMVLLVGTFAAVFGFATLIGLGWAGLLFTGVWAITAGVLFLLGRQRMRRVSPKPEQTIDTLKEDVEWAKHPTRSD